MKTDTSPARGMRDLLPADTAVRDHVLSAITGVYARFGYQRIETPALENIDRLSSGQGGDNEKLIFQVLKRGLPAETAPGALRDLVDLGLRYDLTVPLTRFYGANQARLPVPFRSLQVGPVWRAERPQKGRYRQFYQCDIDIIGEPTILAEAELIEATTGALSAVGLDDVTVRLSDRRLLAALAQAAGIPAGEHARFFIILDKLDKIGWEGVRGELAEAGIPQRACETALDMIAALQDLPAGKLAGTLAATVPGLADEAASDLAATAACLERLAGDPPAGLAVRPHPGPGHGLLHRAGLRDHHPRLRRLGRRRRPVRQAHRPLARQGRPRLRLLHRLRADRGPPARQPAAPQRGRGPRRTRRAPSRRPRRRPRPAASRAASPRSSAAAASFAAQLTRLEAAGFTSYLLMREDDAAKPQPRPLGGETPHQQD